MLVKNLTPFFHVTKVTSRRPPQPEMTVVVRGTFKIVQNGVAEAIEGLEQGFMTGETFADGDAERTGECLYPGDLADMKLNAEVMLRGTCHAPSGRRAVECPVRFSVGGWRKELMVYGDRRWEQGMGGHHISEPSPFERMPLDFAHAFGGPGYAENPVGKGFHTDVLPNVELTSHLITARNQIRPPGSFGPLSSMWALRAGKRGKNYGAAWAKRRAPYFSDDFDWTHFHAAPADQQIEGFLRGDEEVRFHNLHPEHPVLVTRLPGRRVRGFLRDVKGAFREIGLVLDTLFAEPDQGTIKLTWRGVTAVRDDDLADVRTLLLASEAIEEKPLSPEHYRAALDAFEKDPTGVLAALPAGLQALWEQREKERRGEPIAELEGEPTLDPVSREMKRRLGPLMSAEELSAMAGAMAKLEEVPAENRPDLEKMVADSRAAAANTPPPMRVRKPGSIPDPELRPKMREVMAQAAKLREEEKRTGQPLAGIEALEAAPHDPRWKLLDPTYEPPGPLSTDAPGPGADLRERDFTGQDLRGADLTGANLERANLTRANLHGVSLRGAKLARAVLYRTDLGEADLREADLTLVNGAYLQASKADFTKAVLDEAFLEQANLEGAKLVGVRAEYAILEGADLRSVSAVDARFDHVDFSKARLGGAVFRRASAVLALFGEVAAEGLDLEGAELRQASFVEAQLRGARFVGAKARKGFFMKARLDGAELGYADLREAHLTEASAVGARFLGANLRDARLYRTDLTRAELVHANLMGAELRKANLEGASLVRANLYEAVLIGVRGTGFDLTDANLKRVVREPA